MISKIGGPLYWILLVIMLFPFDLVFGEKYQFITPPVALFIGLVFAFTFGIPYPKFNKKLSKYLLQFSVVGLGFGMNLQKSLQSGADGMLFTVISVIGVMVIGVVLGRYMMIDRKTSYLISAGTAICGGSAIAAVGGALKAKENEMAVSLGVIFILNAIALFIFPPLGTSIRIITSTVRHVGGNSDTRHKLRSRSRRSLRCGGLRDSHTDKVHTCPLDNPTRILLNMVFPQG